MRARMFCVFPRTSVRIMCVRFVCTVNLPRRSPNSQPTLDVRRDVVVVFHVYKTGHFACTHAAHSDVQNDVEKRKGLRCGGGGGGVVGFEKVVCSFAWVSMRQHQQDWDRVHNGGCEALNLVPF